MAKKVSALEQYITDNISVPTYFNEHVIGLKPGLTPLSDLTDSASICPFHDDVNPSFRYWKAKGFFMCFGCHCAGDVINLHRLTMQKKLNTRVSRETAIKGICKLYNIQYASRKKKGTEAGDEELVVNNDDSTQVVVEDISPFEKARRDLDMHSKIVEQRKHMNVNMFKTMNAQIRDNPNLDEKAKLRAYAALDLKACVAINATDDRFEVAINMTSEDIKNGL